MAYSTYLDLVNALRDRFNEVHLTSANFSNVVGFDQFTKDAVNYAYNDILNAEMEWPFLHNKSTFTTTPGVQFYSVNTSNEFSLKTIDWDSFFLAPNDVVLEISNELTTIPSVSPYSLSPVKIANWSSDLGVVYNATGLALTPVTTDPQSAGQYTILNGAYYFNSADAGKQVKLNYTTSVASTISVINAIPLSYMDYDRWRQSRLQIDFNDIQKSAFSTPQWVFKSQQQGEIGLSPVPDKIYTVDFECWIDPPNLSAATDVSILPIRFNQIIIDGASKYAYEFREDFQLAQAADARMKAGIARMRIELINRNNDMQSGFYWYPHGFSYTLNTR